MSWRHESARRRGGALLVTAQSSEGIARLLAEFDRGKAEALAAAINAWLANDKAFESEEH